MILLLGLEHAFLLSLGMFSPGLKARGRDKRARHHRVAATEQTKFITWIFVFTVLSTISLPVHSIERHLLLYFCMFILGIA
jgi:hypothetical protein